MNEVIVLGGDEPCGAYLLRIQIDEDLAIRFGRYRQGDPIPVHKGEALYIGSAMAWKGSMTLARRTLRHATRRPPLPPHNIRPTLFHQLLSAGLAPPGLQPPSSKTLFWNVDYLLDRQAVHLRQLFLLRTNRSLEDHMAQMLLDDPACRPIASGLGAHDRPGDTHLLYVYADPPWWDQLPGRLKQLF